MFNVIMPCKEKLPTRHLERSREISTIACWQAIVFLKEIKTKLLYVSTIHLLLLKQKYGISPLCFALLHSGRDDV